MNETSSKRKGRKRANIQAQHVDRTLKQVARLEQQSEEEKGFSEWVSDHITAFSGSMLYVLLHVVWFTLWIAANMFWVDFDPYPFVFLTMIVSLEAIFLSTFVLISQNRQAALGDRRAQLDLQVNMVTEEELTKVMKLVTDIHEHLGIQAHDDEELEEMLKSTDIENLAEKWDEEQGNGEKNGRRKAKRK